MDGLDVVDGGKRIKEELMTYLKFVPKLSEDVRRMLDDLDLISYFLTHVVNALPFELCKEGQYIDRMGF